MSKHSKAGKTPRRLVHVYGGYDATLLTDMISMMCGNVEDALLQMGAQPGQDYTYRDLMNWTMPLVKKIFSDESSPHAKQWHSEWTKTDLDAHKP